LELKGSLIEMNKRLGRAILTNLIQDKTRKLEPKRLKRCEGINERLPHNLADDEKPLKFCHNPWKSRPDILLDCLVKYKEGDEPITLDTVFYIPDLDRFEQEFIEAHLPWESSGKVLCKTCDREWTATWRANQQPAMTSEMSHIMIAGSEITIEQITVELLFQGLSNAEVLAGIRKLRPDRASINTVAWYRSHLIRDRSPRFDKLRAGRILPTSPP
jgi:hypothetical protein